MRELKTWEKAIALLWHFSCFMAFKGLIGYWCWKLILEYL